MATHDFDFDVLKLPFARDEWCDADERMFQACFAILGQYVENELGTDPDEGDDYRGYRLHSADIGPDDPSGMPERPSSDRTAIDLWLWYKTDLPKIEAEYNAEVMRCFGDDDVMTTRETDHPMLREIIITPKDKMMFPYDYPDTVKDEKLRELIDLRRCLWT